MCLRHLAPPSPHSLSRDPLSPRWVAGPGPGTGGTGDPADEEVLALVELTV